MMMMMMMMLVMMMMTIDGQSETYVGRWWMPGRSEFMGSRSQRNVPLLPQISYLGNIEMLTERCFHKYLLLFWGKYINALNWQRNKEKIFVEANVLPQIFNNVGNSRTWGWQFLWDCLTLSFVPKTLSLCACAVVALEILVMKRRKRGKRGESNW